MHKLEQEALDDPFLMDALEGYEANGKDQQANLNLLTERLHQRTAWKTGRIISWRVWSIAASILVILTIGGLWLKKTPEPSEKTADIIPVDSIQVKKSKDTLPAPAPAAVAKAPLVAQNERVAKEPTVLKPADNQIAKPAEKKSVYQQEISAADAGMPAPAPETNVAAGYAAQPAKAPDDKKDHTQQLSEVVVMNYTSKSKQDSMENMLANNNKARVASKPTTVMLQGKVNGVSAVPASQSGAQFDARRIAGIILSKTDGSPVIGAAIRVKGTSKSTVTDTKGYFTLPVSADNETLDIASIGYERKQISAKRGDSVKVELNEIPGVLSEVVTVGYATKKSAGAHPQIGWDDFKKYLQNNASLPDGTEGTVNVTLIVNPDGKVTDIKIKKSLNPTADQKAIDLIKNGSSWVANTNSKPETVNVKVKFQKQ
ncbi:MAG: TonB family protein [Mucilaginibacter sp.]|uniref:energy transducer TonB n=1 Tax=Mucilaginibacter sp. TaxID=1882438 RepID=UPI0031A52FE5